MCIRDSTRALASRLHPGSKVALITSRMGSMGDNTSGGYYGYRMSKAAPVSYTHLDVYKRQVEDHHPHGEAEGRARR